VPYIINNEAEVAFRQQNFEAQKSADEAIRQAFFDAQRKAQALKEEELRINLRKALVTKGPCVREFQIAQTKCDDNLAADKFMRSGNYDAHFTRTRTEFATCILDSKSEYDKCTQYQRCDKRLTEMKHACDEIYKKASKARIASIRSNFEEMDNCYTKSLKLHWKCNDEVNVYD